jgi:hypothetical protein
MRRSLRCAAAVALCVAAVACGGGVEGEYVGKPDETFFNSLTLRSDGKVDIVFVGARHEGSYVVEDGAVVITAPNGDKTRLAIEGDGCLSHTLLGTYCKGGIAAAAMAAAPASSGGEVYEATAREGRITLEFGAARKVKLTMRPARASEMPENLSFDVGYSVTGDQITVNLPGNEPLMLTRAGSDLEGTLNGETVRFVKR